MYNALEAACTAHYAIQVVFVTLHYIRLGKKCVDVILWRHLANIYKAPSSARFVVDALQLNQFVDAACQVT